MQLPIEARDDMAAVVVERYRRASDYRKSYIVHQGLSAESLMLRARSQYDREYTCDDSRMMEEAFGFVPTRYYGVVQQKVNATFDWKLDLVMTSLDSMFTVAPTPEPELDPASMERIRNGIRRELMARMAEVGVADPELLLTAKGDVAEEVQDFLQGQAQALKLIEQARIVSTARKAADRAQIRMRDKLVEGSFRQAYTDFSFDQILHGRGVLRYPFNTMRPVRRYTKSSGVSRKWEMVPSFKHVSIFDFYPIDDSDDLQTNTGNTERTSITKAELINLARNTGSTGYYREVIEDIIEEYNFRGRNWLSPDDTDPNVNWWGLDETMPMLIHEGFFSGEELADMGVTGVDLMDYVSARVEVVGGRTIRCELLQSKEDSGRTFFQAPFKRKGKGAYDSLGLGAMLWDTEQRINRLMHIFEHNVDWASRPPVMRNRSAFDNPNDASQIVPNGQYDIEERFGATGSMPDAIRTMNTVSAQYHLIMTQVGQLLRQADEDAGIPAFAYSSQDFGRSSLGEYSQRMTNALRTVKGLALQEDMHFIEPAFSLMFDREVDADDELREGQDLNVVVRGMTGLLKEDLVAQRQQAIIPLILQSGDSGLLPPQAQQYAIRMLLEQAGFPVDALGMSDPLIDNALAVAAAMPQTGMQAGSQQIPELDGRSGAAAQANVAGASMLNPANLQQTGPMA